MLLLNNVVVPLHMKRGYKMWGSQRKEPYSHSISTLVVVVIVVPLCILLMEGYCFALAIFNLSALKKRKKNQKQEYLTNELEDEIKFTYIS